MSPGIDEVSPSLSPEVSNLRLRCRAHNQYSAERTFGAEFTKHKRERRPASPARQCGAGGLATSPAAGGLARAAARMRW